MKNKAAIKQLFISIISLAISYWSYGNSSMPNDTLSIHFLGSPLHFVIEKRSVQNLINKIKQDEYINHDLSIAEISSLKLTIQSIQKERKLPDWFVYQLIRRISEQINSKYIDYTQYTLTKYLLLAIVGYEPVIFISNDKML